MKNLIQIDWAILFTRFLLSITVLFFPATAYCADNDNLVGCIVDGEAGVDRYSTHTYIKSGSGGLCNETVARWNTTCGSVIEEAADGFTVYFNDPSCSSATITAYDDLDRVIASKSITIVPASPLSGGTISNTSQAINYSTSPTINCSTASNGTGTYNYLWFYSTDNSIFFSTGLTTQDLTPEPLITTTYFKRLAQSGNQSAYSNVATVTVYPQLLSGVITNSQAINYNTTPSPLMVSTPSGGNGVYSYQWQSSSLINGPFQPISGATGTSYAPGPLTATTYFNVVSSSNGVSVTTTTGSVVVYPQLSGGIVSPSSKSVNYFASPGTLTASGVSGGNGSYTYQWQSSTNGGPWTDILGITNLTYDPGPLTTTTYFVLRVTSNGQSIQGTSTKVTVYPELFIGAIEGGNQFIPENTPAEPLFTDNFSGGNRTYTFQWQWSYDNANWFQAGGGRSPSYSPGVLTVTKYYRLSITSNGVTKYSPSVVIQVGPVGVCCSGTSINPGQIQTPVQVIDAGLSADTIRATSASGGAGSYQYRWYKSTDGVQYTPTSVVTEYYPKVNYDNTTFLKRLVTDASSNTAYTCVTKVVVENLAGISSHNYLRTRDITAPDVLSRTAADEIDPDDVIQATQYYDGLGRSMQTVTKRGSPQKKDMVTVQTYDEYDRETRHYLPYTSLSSNGELKITPISDQIGFNETQFPSDDIFNGTSVYESSPLSRPTGSYAAGNSWKNRGIKTQYLFNKTSDEILNFSYNSTTGEISLADLPPDSAAYFPANKLTCKKTIDEEQKDVLEYADTQGRTICKKVKAGDNVYASTYYVYDDFGNLVVVLPPEASRRISNGEGISTTDNN